MSHLVRHVIGCMTGTSLDALDLALVEVTATGLGAGIRFIRGSSRPLGDVGPLLRRIAEGAPVTAREIACTALAFGELHAGAAAELASAVPGGVPDLVAVHGQTVFHAPPLSWQLLNPWPIARTFRCPVVFDLRGADLAAGGQGAPITPLADWLTLRDPAQTVVVANLGGFCNITLLPAEIRPDRSRQSATPGDGASEPSGTLSRVRGRDVCACNQLLDATARLALGVPFDQDGRFAAAGSVNERLRDELTGLLRAQDRSGRSLGTGDELTAWISRQTAATPPLHANDLARTVVEAVGTTIGSVCRESGATRVLLAGGGVHHPVLVAAIGRAAGVKPSLTDAYGVPAAYREAMAIASLGALCQDRVPITLGAVTRSKGPVGVSGCWAAP